MSDLWAALRKDLLLQWRGRAQLVAIFAFGASALLLFSFAIGPDSSALRQHAAGFLACFDRFAETYLEGVTWERCGDIEGRIAGLLPALLLARIDGKSPIEYVTSDQDKNRVREVARSLIARPCKELGAVREAWAREVLRG